MGDADVSVIVVAHDVREEVLTCVESIARHAGRVAVQTIVVDNGSTDGTAAAVAARFPATTVVPLDRNHGVASRNDGMAIARGRYRMFLDSDARLTAGALDRLVKVMDADPDIGLVGPRLVYPDGRLQFSARRFPPLLLPVLRRMPFGVLEHRQPVRRHLMADDDHTRTREVEYVIGACQLFSAEAQRAAGEVMRIVYGPDDADWCFRIRRAGFKVVYCPEAVVVHDYRRATARQPLSFQAVHHLRHFCGFQWKWRHERRRLVQEGRRMDADATRLGRTGAS
jgi:N-acetylglucosaminyl-diphospho-decaprenol L-rhamnosyltransferase